MLSPYLPKLARPCAACEGSTCPPPAFSYPPVAWIVVSLRPAEPAKFQPEPQPAPQPPACRTPGESRSTP